MERNGTDPARRDLGGAAEDRRFPQPSAVGKLSGGSMLIFDLDGTLVDSNGLWDAAQRAFLARRGLAYGEDYRQGTAYGTFPECAAFAKSYFHLSETCEDIMGEWMANIGAAYARVPLKPGVRAYLERRAADGCAMAILTSAAPAHCRTALEQTGIGGYFSRLFFVQEMGVGKTSPELYRMTAAQLGVPPEACVYFDDSAAACRSAGAAGMTAVGVRDEWFQDEEELRRSCHLYIRDFNCADLYQG